MPETRAEMFRKRMHKEVACPSGLTVVIRKISGADLLAELGTIPVEMFGEETPVQQRRPEETRQLVLEIMQHSDILARWEKAVLKLGLVDPRVVDTITNPAEEVTLYDIDPEDRLFLQNTIMEHSGMIGPKSEGLEENQPI